MFIVHNHYSRFWVCVRMLDFYSKGIFPRKSCSVLKPHLFLKWTPFLKMWTPTYKSHLVLLIEVRSTNWDKLERGAGMVSYWLQLSEKLEKLKDSTSVIRKLMEICIKLEQSCWLFLNWLTRHSNLVKSNIDSVSKHQLRASCGFKSTSAMNMGGGCLSPA